jgi:hypothetical protein
MSFLLKCVKKHVSHWMFTAGDCERLRTRARRMLELANRAQCEKNYDFARLLTRGDRSFRTRKRHGTTAP